jgi:hypothetical protein
VNATLRPKRGKNFLAKSSESRENQVLRPAREGKSVIGVSRQHAKLKEKEVRKLRVARRTQARFRTVAELPARSRACGFFAGKIHAARRVCFAVEDFS